MPFSLSQSWDAVTAPATPSDWNYDAAYVTSTTRYSTAPNSLDMASPSSSSPQYATYATADPDGGSMVDCTALVYFSSLTSGDVTSGGLTFRCSSATMNNTSTSCYWVRVSVNTSGSGAVLSFSKIVNGAITNLAAVTNSDAGLTLNAWFSLRVASVGLNKFNVVATRLSDGYTMNSSGVFVSSSTTAISNLTAADVASGGYYGLAGAASTVVGSTLDKVYFDDVAVNATVYTMPIPPRKAHVVPIPFQYYRPD